MFFKTNKRCSLFSYPLNLLSLAFPFRRVKPPFFFFLLLYVHNFYNLWERGVRKANTAYPFAGYSWSLYYFVIYILYIVDYELHIKSVLFAIVLFTRETNICICNLLGHSVLWINSRLSMCFVKALVLVGV